MRKGIPFEERTMPNTTIFVHTSASSAILTASQHGRHALHVDLSTWSEDEKTWLSEHIIENEGACFANPDYYARRTHEAGWDPPRWIDVAPPTVERLKAIVLEGMTDDLKKDAEEKAKRQKAEEDKTKRIENALEYLNTCPIENFIDTRYTEPQLRRAHIVVADLRYEDNSEYAINLVPHRRPELDAHLQKLEADKREKLEAEEAKRAAKEKEKVEWRKAFTFWLNRNGYEEQSERCEAGVLPHEEACAIIREKIVFPEIEKKALNFRVIRLYKENEPPSTWSATEWDNIKGARSVLESIKDRWDFEGADLTVGLQLYTSREWIYDPDNEDADSDGDVLGPDVNIASIEVSFCGIRTYTHVLL